MNARVLSWMERKFALVLPLSLVFNAAGLFGIVSLASPIQAEDSRLERLFRSYIAPCCWTASLGRHDSEASRKVRAQIETMVHDGRSDDEIKSALVGAYGRRILALPDGKQGKVLFAMPVVMIAAGLLLVSGILCRLRRRVTPVVNDVAPAALEVGWDAE